MLNNLNPVRNNNSLKNWKKISNGVNIPRFIYLYNQGIKDLNFNGLKNFIKNNFGKIDVKVIRLKKDVVQTKGLIFDFLKTKEAFDKISPKDKEACHIILTNKILATYDENKKLHIRAAIYGFPSVISLPGIVEGPAKPREYYLYKQRFLKLGIWQIEEPRIKKRLKDRFIDYKDRRINEIIKGYISQALFLYITGEPFCSRKTCRLFNSHWQQELINSQIKIGRFCPIHKKALKEIRKKI